MNEAQFSKWMIDSWLSGPQTMAQRIETSTASGVPDIYMVHQGYPAWLETKIVTPRNSVLVRPYQRAWAHKHSLAGGVSLIVAYREDHDLVLVWMTNKTEFEPSGKYLAIKTEAHFSFTRNSSSRLAFLDLIKRLNHI